eukprot:SAG11_NODE_21564_length_422_cov_39.027864_1_plen_28_part_10
MASVAFFVEVGVIAAVDLSFRRPGLAFK